MAATGRPPRGDRGDFIGRPPFGWSNAKVEGWSRSRLSRRALSTLPAGASKPRPGPTAQTARAAERRGECRRPTGGRWGEGTLRRIDDPGSGHRSIRQDREPPRSPRVPTAMFSPPPAVRRRAKRPPDARPDTPQRWRRANGASSCPTNATRPGTTRPTPSAGASARPRSSAGRPTSWAPRHARGTSRHRDHGGVRTHGAGTAP